MAKVSLRKAIKDGGAMLFRLARLLAIAENSEIACCSVTIGQALALLAMGSGNKATMGQVRKALGVSPGTATRVIDNLVRDGLVERTGNSGDRRQVCICPTPIGRKKITELDECYSRFWGMIFKGIPNARLPETLGALGLLVQAVENVRDECCRAPLVPTRSDAERITRVGTQEEVESR